MKKVRLRELPDWPPIPGGAQESGIDIPRAEETVVMQVFSVNDLRLTLRGESRGRPCSCHYTAPTKGVAEAVRGAIAANMGKTVAELGSIEIEVDEGVAKAARSITAG